MIGVAIIVVVLLVVIPVGAVLLPGAFGAAVIGTFLRREADASHEGSELVDLNG